MASGHTSGLRAGASGWFADSRQLGRVSEALPANRSSQYLMRSEFFDARHGTATTRTEPGAGGFSLRLCGVLRMRSGCEELPAQGQQISAAAVCEEAAETDPHKAARKRVEQEPPQELFGGDGHQPLFCSYAHNPSIEK